MVRLNIFAGTPITKKLNMPFYTFQAQQIM